VTSGGWLGPSGVHGRQGPRRNSGVARWGSASLEARGGGVHDRIRALPDGIGLCPLATVPASVGHGGGTVELARRLCGGIVRILRRLFRPPVASGGWLGLSRGLGRRVHDGIGVLPDGIGLCPLAIVPARAGHGGTGSPPVRGHRQNFTKALRAAGGLRRVARPLRRPGALPDGIGLCPLATVPARAGHGRVLDGIGALPDGIWLCPLATVPARAGHVGGTVELARRPCGGIVRILRRLSEPPGGRQWPPEGGPASLEVMGGGVHDGIGALPD